MNLNHINDISSVALGREGEQFVCKMLIERGYCLYKSNMRRWGFEIDLILYKAVPDRNVLEIRLIEVKTRKSGRVPTLADLKIDRKILRYKHAMFDICQNVYRALIHEGVYSDRLYGLESGPNHDSKGERMPFLKCHTDLAIVGSLDPSTKSVKNLYLQKYIQNVNLLI